MFTNFVIVKVFYYPFTKNINIYPVDPFKVVR